ncbi:MAG: DUF4382 domain-containing protein [Gammaproteobacteria bacterium]|nr:DUF4382 domain-containing protein [Gammaproteobacteria bacterium]NNL50726.1 DUF4382 domain-containing protein [Woeseiaceae bacterium]
MKSQSTKFMVAATMATFLYGCGGGSSEAPPPNVPATGNLTISLTDDPWEDAMEMVLHVTGVEMGHADGSVVMVAMDGGGMSIDMMQLQNGESRMLADNVEMPIGQYDWMRLMIDPAQSHIDLASTGGRHGMQMGGDAIDGLEVQHTFEIGQSQHSEFMLDFDIRRGVQHHDTGMMGGEYRLHSAMRMVDMSDSGGLMGAIDPAMIDVNHADCDDAPGGNWAYLYHGDVMEPDDIADVDTDGMDGPIAADRIDMDTMTGEHRYHFGYLDPGQYRVAITCSGEWDEVGDDDHPTDPDGQFTFQMYSEAMEVMSGQMHDNDLSP